MKRFGIGMMFGMMAVALMDESGDGGDGGGNDPVVSIPATKGDQTAPPAAPPAAPQGDDVLDKAGYASVENDPGLNYAMGFLAQNGFNADNPAVEAAFGGDFSLLKAQLGAKGIQGWEQAIGLAEQSYDRHLKAGEATAAEVGGIVTAYAEERGVDWEAAVAHVAKVVSPEVRTAINGLLASPATAALAALFITDSYANADGVEFQPTARATSEGGQAHAGPQGGALTRAQYTAEMKTLQQALGNDYINSPQAQQLYARLIR